MMINKRLIGTVAESKRYIVGNVILQWCSLVANIAMMFGITNLFAGLYYGNVSSGTFMEHSGGGNGNITYPVSLYHRRLQDELPLLQSGQENPAGADLRKTAAVRRFLQRAGKNLRGSADSGGGRGSA